MISRKYVTNSKTDFNDPILILNSRNIDCTIILISGQWFYENSPQYVKIKKVIFTEKKLHLPSSFLRSPDNGLPEPHHES